MEVKISGATSLGVKDVGPLQNFKCEFDNDIGKLHRLCCFWCHWQDCVFSMMWRNCVIYLRSDV